MKITTKKALPSPNELIKILEREFSEKYQYKLFGLGSNKSIIVGQSTLVGAQLSVYENDILIQPTIPNEFGGLFLFVGLVEPVVFLLPFLFSKKVRNSPERSKDLVRDLGIFLQQKYN